MQDALDLMVQAPIGDPIQDLFLAIHDRYGDEGAQRAAELICEHLKADGAAFVAAEADPDCEDFATAATRLVAHAPTLGALERDLAARTVARGM